MTVSAPISAALRMLCLATMLAAPAASAAVLYDQPGSLGSCNCRTSTQDQNGNGFRTYDNFTLADAAAVTAVEWQGWYWDSGTPANNPPTPATNAWTIGFFADNGGEPGALLFSETFLAGDVDATSLGNTTFSGDPVVNFRFRAELSSAFLAAAGTQYWFSPLSEQTNFNPLFAWTTDGAGTGDGTSIQDFLNNGSRSVQSSDRNFLLEGTAVPEPGMTALFCAGLAGLVLLRRARVTPAAPSRA